MNNPKKSINNIKKKKTKTKKQNGSLNGNPFHAEINGFQDQ